MIKTILRNCNQHSLNCPSSTTVRGDTFQDVRGPRRETTVSSQSPPLTVVGKRLPSMEAQVETMEPEPESEAMERASQARARAMAPGAGVDAIEQWCAACNDAMIELLELLPAPATGDCGMRGPSAERGRAATRDGLSRTRSSSRSRDHRHPSVVRQDPTGLTYAQRSAAAASTAKYVKMPVAPARLNDIRLSSTTSSRSSHPLSAAPASIEYSPLTW